MRPSFATLALTCAIISPACGGDDSPANPDASVDAAPVAPAFAPDEMPYGSTLGQWAARWWTWALELPSAGHPITGGPCDTGQAGDVFFLAGNFGGVESRTCTVPPGKAVMFPILNSLCRPAPELDGCATPSSLEDLQACAGGIFDFGANRTLRVTLDGVDIADPESYRANTGVFSWPPPAFAEGDGLLPGLGAIPANACGIPEGDRFGLGDGYWMVLRPLTPGPHTLRIVGTVETFALDVTYQLAQQ